MERSVERDVSELKTSVAHIEGTVTVVSEVVKRMETRQERMETRQEKIEDKMGGLAVGQERLSSMSSADSRESVDKDKMKWTIIGALMAGASIGGAGVKHILEKLL